MTSPSIGRNQLSSNTSGLTNASSFTADILVSQGYLNSATPPPYTRHAIREADIDSRRPIDLVDNEIPSDVLNWSEDDKPVPPFTATDDETPTLDDEVPPYVISCDDSCAILPEEPAVWQVEGTDIKLSMIAASVLLRHSLLTPKDLECIANITGPPGRNYTLPDFSAPNPGSPSSELKSEPTESRPTELVVGVASALFETVAGILIGLAAGPMEAIHQVQSSKSQTISHSEFLLTFEDRRGPHPFDEVAIGTVNGVGRVVAEALKAPVLVTTNVSMGLHNAPKLFGDDTVKDVERVEGLEDGIAQAGKEFGTGLYDGITGLVTQPFNGAKKEGVLGGFKGLGKGIVGAVCKPAAGVVGLPAYTLLGLWREGEKLDAMIKESQSEVGAGDGGEVLSEEIRNIVEKWDILIGREKRG